MTHQHHRALIVEDECEAAVDLVEVLKKCDCEGVTVTNRRDALARLEEAMFCIILLDLQIKAEPDSIRGKFEHGTQFLKEARGRHPELFGPKYSLPIVVLSGFASETEAAVAVMRDGASDVVQKLATREQKADRICEALEAAGRTSHRVCQERAATFAPVNAPRELTLSILSEQVGRRVVVCLGERRATLTHVALKVLLHLVKARLSGSLAHKIDLGARRDQGFRGVSVLRDQLAKAYDGDGKQLVTNDQRGGYGLAERLKIGRVDADGLERLGDQEITKLARDIRRLSATMQESVGKG